jgi:hypothetical protein
LGALIGGTRKQVQRQVEEGFPKLPSGCSIELDRKSSEIVLRSLRNALPSRWSQKVEELRLMAADSVPSLRTYLDLSGLDLEDIYQGGHYWSELKRSAGVPIGECPEGEEVIGRAIGRLLHVNDPGRIEAYRSILSNCALGEPTDLSSTRSLRMARMLTAQLVGQVSSSTLPSDSTVSEALKFLSRFPDVCREGAEVMGGKREEIDHVFFTLPGRANNPLVVHGQYTRLEILAGFGHGGDLARVMKWREGVLHLPEESSDLLAITFDKSSGNFSPKTRYRDYAISPESIHWESQSSTRASSATGVRYQQHQQLGHEIMLFARLNPGERFWFLGPAKYRSHRGERPMAIIWDLEFPLPGDLFAKFAVAAA